MGGWRLGWGFWGWRRREGVCGVREGLGGGGGKRGGEGGGWGFGGGGRGGIVCLSLHVTREVPGGVGDGSSIYLYACRREVVSTPQSPKPAALSSRPPHCSRDTSTL